MLVPESGGHSGCDVLGGGGEASSAVRLRSARSFRHVGCTVTSLHQHGYHHGFCPQQLLAGCSLPLPGDFEGPPFLSRTA
jgi:hypothetical protein